MPNDTDQTSTTVKSTVTFDVPKNACDCHTHVFLDPITYPFSDERKYTPPSASVADLLAFQVALRFDRVVIVNPSVYGEKLEATIEGLNQLGPDRARGVAVYSKGMKADDMDRLHNLGFRGVRLNLDTDGVSEPKAAAEMIMAAAEQIASRGWHLEMYVKAALIGEMIDVLDDLAVPIVFDHFAGANGMKGVDQPGFDAVLQLLRAGKAYATLSGAYRGSREAPNYPGFAPIATALIEANEDRILWASDWPHPGAPMNPETVDVTRIRQPYVVDDGRMLNLLPTWAPDAAVRQKILVSNAERLYGFA